jgi:hypothetical protein
MKTITRSKEIKVQNDTDHAIAWLVSEYPKGVSLVYVDYNDSYEDPNTLQEVIKQGYQENENWRWDSQSESIYEIIENYRKEIEADEISDETTQEMSDWLFDHDTSDPITQLLKNTGDKLFYIETVDESYDDKSNTSELIKKYSKSDEQKKEIKYVINEQFYSAPVSFYFYASPLSVFNAIHDYKSKKDKPKYICIKGAYFSTIDRVQGSNYLGDKAVFDIAIPYDNFVQNIYLDSAKGNGYGWGSIAGQTGYSEADILISDTAKGYTIIETETSEVQKLEL